MIVKVSIYYFIYTFKTNTKGEAPIYCKIVVNGKQKRFSTCISILSKLWDATKQKVKGKNLIAEDIKKMKTLKTDILSITPVLPENDSDDFSASDIREQPFDELVKNFYRKRFQVDIREETLALLMQIMEEN